MTESVNKCDVTEIKSLSKPPLAVKDTMSAIVCLLGYKKPQAESWNFAIKLINGAVGESFFEQLKKFEPKPVSSKKMDYVKDKLEGLSEDSVRKVSHATVGCYKWAKATLDSLPVEDAGEKSAS